MGTQLMPISEEDAELRIPLPQKYKWFLSFNLRKFSTNVLNLFQIFYNFYLQTAKGWVSKGREPILISKGYFD